MTIGKMTAEIRIVHCVVQQRVESLCPLGSVAANGGIHSLGEKIVSSQFLHLYAVKDNGFLHSIMTCDDSWFHHVDVETK